MTHTDMNSNKIRAFSEEFLNGDFFIGDHKA